jgi:sensor histidine kinase YesM
MTGRLKVQLKSLKLAAIKIMLNGTTDYRERSLLRGNTLFWMANLCGWILFYVAQGLTFPGFQKWTPIDRSITIAINILWIVVLTGLYRSVYKRWHFEQVQLRFTLIQASVAIVVIWLIDLTLRVYVNDLLYALLDVNLKPGFKNAFTEMEVMSMTNKSAADYIYQTYTYGQLMKFCSIVIWMAVYNAYHFVTQTKNAKIEKLNILNQLKEVELENLREQLSPHFLFNALNTIHSLTEFDAAKASKATLLLSDLMRYTLNYEKRDVVTVKEELDMVRNYLLLEQIRFGDKLQFLITTGTQTLDKQIPLVMIQTLAENALKHGVRKNKTGGMVTIATEWQNNSLLVRITNPGQLLQKESGPKGIGIINSQERLRLLFGKEARLQLQNKNEKEVELLLTIPQ